MMKRYVLILFSLWVVPGLWAQPLTFSKAFTSPSMLSFREQAYDPEGYWLLMDDKRIMKVDTAGNKEWEKEISTDQMLLLQNIQYTGNHRFLLTAFHLTNETLHFITVDGAGNIIKALTAAGTVSYGEHSFIGQDSLLIVGQRDNGSGAVTGFADLVDGSTGNRLWSYKSTEANVEFTGATRISSRVIGLFGRQGGPGLVKAMLTATDVHGHELWTRTYTAPTHATINSVVQAHDHSLRAILWKGASSALLSLEEDGTFRSQQEFPFAISRYIVRGEHDNTFLIAGNSRDRMFLAKADVNSTILWWRYYGSSTKSEFGDAIQGCAMPFNTSIMLWGAWRRDSRSSPFVIRTDEEGLVQRTLPAGINKPQQPIKGLSGKVIGYEPQLLTSVRTGRGEVLVGGFHYQSLAGQADPVPVGLFAKVNADGDTLWTKNISSILDPVTQYTSYVTNVKMVSGGDYALLVQGRNANSGSTLLQVKPDSRMTWNSPILSGKRTDLVESTPGEFLSCGHAFDIQRYNERGVFHKANLPARSLNMLSTTLLGSMVHTITPSGNGTFYVTGEQIEVYKVERKGYWAEINTDGSVLKSNTHDLAYKTTINATALTTQGELICAGAVEDEDGDKDLLLMLIDASGNMVWRKTFDFLNQDDGFSIAVLPDGYLVAGEAGRPAFGLQESFAYIAKFAIDGNLVWKNLIGSPGLYCRAVKVYPDTDSTALLTGNVEERNSGSPSFASTAFIETIRIDTVPVTHTADDLASRPAVYPNPFRDRLMIRCLGDCIVTVITLQGQTAKKMMVMDEGLPVPLDVADLPEGIYVIDVESNSRRWQFKMVKVGD